MNQYQLYFQTRKTMQILYENLQKLTMQHRTFNINM